MYLAWQIALDTQSPNESMKTNRRCLRTLMVEQKLQRAVHAPSLLSAAVAYRFRYAGLRRA